MEAQTYHLRIGEGRRIVLPTEVCRELGFGVGDSIIVRLDDGRATLNSALRTIERFQRLVATKISPDVSLVDELIAERESAALHE